MIRPILALLALVIALGAWCAWLEVRAEHARSQRDRSGALFTPEEAEELRRSPALRIELAGQSHVYGRVGGSWRCWSYRRAPCDGAAIQRLIDALAHAEGIVHASSVEEAPDFGINVPETIRISIAGPRALEDPSGDVRATLEIGTTIPGAGAFVRKRGTKEIFAIDGDPRAELETRAAAGLPPLLAPGVVPQDWAGWNTGLVRIEIERRDGTRTVLERRELERDPDPLAQRFPWTWVFDPGPDERELALELAQSYAGFLERVPYADVLEAQEKQEHAFEPPAARVVLQGREGESLVLDLAAPAADGRVPLWVAASETVYLIEARVAGMLAPEAGAFTAEEETNRWAQKGSDEPR